jgi:hypothetical protein
MLRLIKKFIKSFLPDWLIIHSRSKIIFKNYYNKNKSRKQKSSIADVYNKSLLQNLLEFRTGPKFCPPKGFQNTSLVCWQLKTEVLQLPHNSKKLIYIADGRVQDGGLADRLRGMVSLYRIACDIGVEFKINFTSPDKLTNYLIPNMYDWTIDQNDIIYDVRESVICTFFTNVYIKDVFLTIQKLLKRYNQLHVTTNLASAEAEYGALFNFLFKPSPELHNLIEYNLSQIGCNFISATFRFQSLLGDFYEGHFQSLPEEERPLLIKRCLEHLKEIHTENNAQKILVTSDSITFLQEAKKLDFVYVIPGEIAHIDYTLGLNKSVYMKSFLDYFLLTYSQKIYLVVDGKMYNSGFAYRASLHRSPYIIKRYK